MQPWKPTNLHVGHSWGGGLERWINDFSSHDQFSRNLVLASVGVLDSYGLGLSLRDGSTGSLLESWVLQKPICESAIQNEEYRKILSDVIAVHGIEHLYISSFIGHSLDLLDLNLPTTIVYHDYFPYCLALNLVYSRLCSSCTPSELKNCLVDNPLSFLFRQNDLNYWTAYRDSYFRRLSGNKKFHHICPSRSVAENLQRVDSRFENVEFKVVEHGIQYTRRDCFGNSDVDSPLRLLILGKLDSYKGVERLQRIYHFVRLVADIHLVGCREGGFYFENRARINVIESYNPEDLPNLLEQIKPDLAVFLATVPETFSYTLSEVFAHCIPACASPIGSFRDRIVPGENGILLADLDDETAVRKILDLARDREELKQISAKLATTPVRHVSEMVNDYYDIRGDCDLIVQRRAEFLRGL